jgi:hypothetical protein
MWLVRGLLHKEAQLRHRHLHRERCQGFSWLCSCGGTGGFTESDVRPWFLSGDVNAGSGCLTNEFAVSGLRCCTGSGSAFGFQISPGHGSNDKSASMVPGALNPSNALCLSEGMIYIVIRDAAELFTACRVQRGQ